MLKELSISETDSKRTTSKTLLDFKTAVKKIRTAHKKSLYSTPTRHKHLIGLILPVFQCTSLSLLVSSLSKELDSLGYTLIVKSLKNDSDCFERQLEALLDLQIKGLLLAEIELSKKQQQRLEILDIPIVSIDISTDLQKADAILLNNRTATQQVLERMIVAGHRKIGVLASPPKSPNAKEQMLGIADTFHDNQPFLEYSEIFYSDYSTESGYTGMLQLLNKKATAVFACNYNVAMGALQALYQQNTAIVQNFTFASFDYMDTLTRLSPNWITIRQPIAAISQLAANRIAKKIQSQNKLMGATYIQYNKIYWQNEKRLSKKTFRSYNAKESFHW